MERIAVYVHADDPISQAGVASQLRPRPEVRVLDAVEAEQASVALVVADRVSERTLQVLRSRQRGGARLVARDPAGIRFALPALLYDPTGSIEPPQPNPGCRRVRGPLRLPRFKRGLRERGNLFRTGQPNGPAHPRCRG